MSISLNSHNDHGESFSAIWQGEDCGLRSLTASPMMGAVRLLYNAEIRHRLAKMLLLPIRVN